MYDRTMTSDRISNDARCSVPRCAVRLVHASSDAERASVVVNELSSLEMDISARCTKSASPGIFRIQTGSHRAVEIDLDASSLGALETVLQSIVVDPLELPILLEGESKILRSWTDKIVVEELKPTVYSYTMNRYGTAVGTDAVRVAFSAALFREMANLPGAMPFRPQSAFLAKIQHQGISYLVQRRVEASNLEIRVKRYHIGSPLHRYKYTDKHSTTQTCGPLTQWSRFDKPVVCFDWRNPLQDDSGQKLADEPISEDYAAVWMDAPEYAREMSRQTFCWLESRFARAGVLLVDMCMFVDFSGKTIYGELSPDCMRIRFGLEHPSQARAGDKDLWRQGAKGEELLERYAEAYTRIYGEADRPQRQVLVGPRSVAGTKALPL